MGAGKGWLVLLACLLVGCGETDMFAGQYAVTPGGEAQFRISSDDNLYVLEKRHDDAWGDRRELDKMVCPPALVELEQSLEEQRPTLVCLGQQGGLLAALLHLEKPQGSWQRTGDYLIIGMPLPLYRVAP